MTAKAMLSFDPEHPYPPPPPQTSRVLAALDGEAINQLVLRLDYLVKAHDAPDRQLCCSGQDCGCMGATAQQEAMHYAKEILARLKGIIPTKINWRDDPTAIVEDDNPQIGRDYA